MNFASLVREARSCRRFVEDERVHNNSLTWLVDMARVCPSARNAQGLRYVIVASPQMCAAIFPHTKWAGALKWDGPCMGERPTGYIAILTPEKPNKNVYIDVGIAAQTIQLGAQNNGIGCCMHASFKPKECSEILSVPEGMEIALLLGLGIEKEKRIIATMPEDGNVNYWRDANGVHFVPKRELNEVLLNTL